MLNLCIFALEVTNTKGCNLNYNYNCIMLISQNFALLWNRGTFAWLLDIWQNLEESKASNIAARRIFEEKGTSRKSIIYFCVRNPAKHNLLKMEKLFLK